MVPLAYAMAHNSIDLAKLLFEHGATLPIVVPRTCHTERLSSWSVSQEESGVLEGFGFNLEELFKDPKRAILLLSKCVSNQWTAADEREDWDGLAEDRRQAMLLLGWSKFAFNRLQRVATHMCGSGPISEEKAREVATD